MASDFKSIEGAEYRPLFKKDKLVVLQPFKIQETAVTNRDFLTFVKLHPEWRKTQVKKIFADNNYLSHWSSELSLGSRALPDSPVVFVSWFAAKSYCEENGWRLPTVDEWEYLAQFGPDDNSRDAKSVILEWYSKPNAEKVPETKSTFKNKFGVWDIHGLIWEWNYDFNTTFVTGESRGDSALEKSMFCGTGTGSADPSDYAAFMRFGFRSSLKGSYTVGNLGFRCIQEIKK